MCSMSKKIWQEPLEMPPMKCNFITWLEKLQDPNISHKIYMYNDCLQMTSFAATFMGRKEFNSVFSIKEVYYKVGSLLPLPDQSYTFCKCTALMMNKQKSINIMQIQVDWDGKSLNNCTGFYISTIDSRIQNSTTA